MTRDPERTTLVCLFHNPERAHAALREILTTGVPASSVSLIGQGASRGSTARALSAVHVPASDQDRLLDSLDSGGAIVTVTAVEQLVDTIEGIFTRHRAQMVNEADIPRPVQQPVAQTAQHAEDDAELTRRDLHRLEHRRPDLSPREALRQPLTRASIIPELEPEPEPELEQQPLPQAPSQLTSEPVSQVSPEPSPEPTPRANVTPQPARSPAYWPTPAPTAAAPAPPAPASQRPAEPAGMRVFRRIIEIPISHAVPLRENRVRIDRSSVDRNVSSEDVAAGYAPFQDETLELTETSEELIIGTEPRVVEEVLVGRDSPTRTQQIHDKVRRTEIQVQGGSPSSGTKADDVLPTRRIP